MLEYTGVHESPGTVIIPTSEIGRYTMFMVSLAGTEQPFGSNLSVMASASVTENINAAIRSLRPEDQWVWILGDDHVWKGDCLMQLLKDMEITQADIMVPLVLKRSPPWHLVIFHKAEMTERGQGWLPWRFNEVPEHGCFEVDGAGSAGMLIRREVLDAMGDPWFESSDGIILNEDVNFCMKARELGFSIFANADATMGHLGIFNVRPLFRNGNWGALTEFSSAEEQYKHLYMPMEDLEEPVTNAR